MMYINNYGTDFMFSGHGVCNISIYSIVSRNFQFTLQFSRYHSCWLKFLSTGFDNGIYL